MTLIDPLIQNPAAGLAPPPAMFEPLPEATLAPASAASSPGSVAAAAAAVPPSARTIWGLDPVQLHTRYWASLGVQVVRPGEPSEIVRHAELYLLTDPASLSLFKLGPLMDVLNWVK